MGVEWKTAPLSELAQIASGKRPKVISKSRSPDCKVPVYGGGGFSGYTTDALYPAGALVTGRVGTLGKLFAPRDDFWPTDNTIVIIPQSPQVDNTFLRYSLEPAIPFLASVNRGVANPLITQKDVQQLVVHLPPLQEQRAIAHILGTLDDKIELNRRMNETLEAMARALFKSWFVDFDPVVVNAIKAGNPIPEKFAKRAAHYRQNPAALRLPEHILRLFPDRFVHSELGPIPEGWEVKALDEIAHFQNGLALQKYRPKPGEARLPVVKIAQLRSGQPDSGEWASANIRPDCIIDDGDVVFSWSGSLILKIWCGGRAALNQHLFKVTSHRYPTWFYYYWIAEHLPKFIDIASDKATTMGHIKRHHLSEAKCFVPRPEFLEGTSFYFDALFSRWVHNELENRGLASIRDTLLPKLISGEYRIRDVEKILEDTI